MILIRAPDPSTGVLLHPPGQQMHRHAHALAHLTLVLAGRFMEAGSHGRRELLPGDVVLRRSFDAHYNMIGSCGARVLVLPLGPDVEPVFGRVRDVDHLMKTARKDPAAAIKWLDEQIEPLSPTSDDWPDLLADQLRTGWAGSLGEFAETQGCRPETVSRAFFRLYGCSPRDYRVAIRSGAAANRIRSSRERLIEIAASTGFSDQAHMCRAIRDLTGQSPKSLRALASAS